MKKTVKRTICIVLSLLFALSVVGCGGSGGGSSEPAESAAAAPASEPINIVIGHAFPTNTPPLGTSYAWVGDLISEELGGAVTFSQAGDGSLVDDSTFLDGILDGVVDMGHCLVTYAAGVIPEAACLGIPGYFAGDAERWLEFCKAVEGPLTDIYAKYGLVYFGADMQGFSAFCCTKKQIVTPEDCQGLIIRASGTDLANSIENWGASPTVMGLGDVATGLERGTIDAIYTAQTLMGQQRFYELGKYMTLTNLRETWGSCVINADVFSKLTKEQQDVILSHGIDYSAHASDEYFVMMEQYYKDMEDAGTSMVWLTEEQEAAFVDLCKPQFEEFGKNTNELGLALLKVIYEFNNWEWTF